MTDRPSHDWSAAGTAKHFSISDEDDSPAFVTPILDYAEAERYVEELRKFEIEEVGSSGWMEQHRRLEKLNLQAHQSAISNSEEFVLEAFLTFQKLDVLISELLIIETWKENVYPELLDRVAGRNSLRVYFVLYHEATLINLFEVLLYHKHVLEAAGELSLELVDYAARKLTRLQSGYDFRIFNPTSSMATTSSLSTNSAGSDEEKAGLAAQKARELNEELAKRTPQEDLAQHLTEIEFKVCISACTLARYLTEHADALPLNVVSRITDTHD